jgi:NTP pyrophosphatase (non-canonical NTP hydrolase)
VDLSKIQEMLAKFEQERGWDKFPASQVFAHLIEELGEVARHITVEEGYKVVGLGHEAPKKQELAREFAQVVSLLFQLANHYEIDLEKSIFSELKVMKDRFPAKAWSEYMEGRQKTKGS